ncbi:MAG: permease-like cell division protein FtsX [Clostridiales bacterium]|jgi:cell division transport system permease protein|nr:permease-like cell division protein FtsX [Clostridiales bacterium]
MKFSSINYYIAEGVRSLFRNRLMSAASVLTVASCAMIFLISFCVASNVDYLLTQLENKVGVSAIISDSLSADEVNALYVKVKAVQYVSDVKFISAEDALKIYRDTFGEEDKELLQGLEDDNPLPRSFTISLESNKYQRYVIYELEKYVGKGFDSIHHASDEIELLLTINNGARIVGFVLILTLGLISVIIIMNTIKLTVAARSAEIGIMKYVGATDWFIRWPFVIEGVVIGIVGSAAAVAICLLSYNRVMRAVASVPILTGVASFRTSAELFFKAGPMAVAAGALIGTAGSAASVRRYLKV